MRAVAIIKERYADFGPTFACEKLSQCHGLTLSKETVHHQMTDPGLWIPRKQRPPKIHQPRNRRSRYGELIQIDGSAHTAPRFVVNTARSGCVAATRRTRERPIAAGSEVSEPLAECPLGRTHMTERERDNAAPLLFFMASATPDYTIHYSTSA